MSNDARPGVDELLVRRRLALCLVVAAALLPGCPRSDASPPPGSAETTVVCSASWYRTVEEKLPTGDGQGHGPDIGSDEWKSVVEFKLGIRGDSDVPSRDGDAWCRHVDRLLESAPTPSGPSDAPPVTNGPGPSFDCAGTEAGSIEAMICRDADLSALDRKLSGVYAAAAEKAADEHPPLLRAEQRGWIKGRDDCWKSDHPRGCVENEYVHRIAELQARYRLVPFDGPVRFACDDDPANEVVATYFRTDPPTLIAERGDSASLMFLQPSGSGSRYQGRNESLWEHQGEASITWGYGAPGLRCRRTP